MTEKIVTNKYKLHTANQLLESITEDSNSVYYLFASKHTPYEDGDNTIEEPLDSVSYISDIRREIVFGKRISSSDAMLLITRNDWEANTIYSQYDDIDEDLFDAAFYATVNAGSYYHTYKCLYNAGNVASTVEPSFVAVSENDPYFETSDGYIWKYMFTVSSDEVTNFATTTLFPVRANSSVTSAARDGAIDTIFVTSAGNNYSNYLSGNNVFSSDHIRLNGNTLLYDISSNSTASGANDFYNGCYIYITGGTNNEEGQYRKITDYFVNSTSKTIVVETAFTNAIGSAATYNIYPGVLIVGTGEETTNAVARAIVNTSTNTIHRIEMLNNGLGYIDATASVYASPEINVTDAELRVIKSPLGGHGANTAAELGSHILGITVKFSNTESNTIPIGNDFRTVGILKDPVFANVEIEVANLSGTFLNGETVYKINPLRLGVDAVVNSSCTSLTSDAGDLSNQFESGDPIFLTVDFGDSGNSSFLGTVNSVTNSSHLVLSTNASFTSNDVSYYVPRKSTSGEVTFSNTTVLLLDDVVGLLSSNDVLVGEESGAVLTINSISRSGVSKGFTTFINAHKYIGEMVSGTLVEDERLLQDEANANFHSLVDSNVFYVTSKSGTFSFNTPIIGANSGAIASFSEYHPPEIAFGSGDVLFIENLEPIERSETQSEMFKIKFEF